MVVGLATMTMLACGESAPLPLDTPEPTRAPAMGSTMVETPDPTATRTVALQDQGKWQMGSGSNDGNPQGKTDWITLVLSSDDGGYTSGGLPDETVLAIIPNPPKRWAVALTPGMMGKGRRTGQARFQ